MLLTPQEARGPWNNAKNCWSTARLAEFVDGQFSQRVWSQGQKVESQASFAHSRKAGEKVDPALCSAQIWVKQIPSRGLAQLSLAFISTLQPQH